MPLHEFLVMTGHPHFMSALRDGELAIYRTFSGDPERVAVEGGLAEGAGGGD